MSISSEQNQAFNIEEDDDYGGERKMPLEDGVIRVWSLLRNSNIITAKNSRVGVGFTLKPWVFRISQSFSEIMHFVKFWLNLSYNNFPIIIETLKVFWNCCDSFVFKSSEIFRFSMITKIPSTPPSGLRPIPGRSLRSATTAGWSSIKSPKTSSSESWISSSSIFFFASFYIPFCFNRVGFILNIMQDLWLRIYFFLLWLYGTKLII